MQAAVFRASQLVMPCAGLWAGLSSYAWLCNHPAIVDPLSGGLSVGVAVWLLGGSLVDILSRAIANAHADACKTHTRPAFYSMLIAAGTLALGILAYLTK